MSTNEWASVDHALAYLGRADRIPHRTEGEAVMLDHVSLGVRRVLDLGTGDGRLLALLKIDRPETRGVALDFSPVLLEKARERFAGDPLVEIVDHNLDEPLPGLGRFDAVVSCFAIHHLSHERKRSLYAETFAVLEPGGVFCNLVLQLQFIRQHTPSFVMRALGLGLVAPSPVRPTEYFFLGWPSAQD